MGQPTPLTIALFFVIFAWQLFWRGMALWKAAQYKQRNWFIALIALSIINTAGVIEIVFLMRFAKTKLTVAEVKSWFSKSR